jgi:hypothetical protein
MLWNSKSTKTDFISAICKSNYFANFVPRKNNFKPLLLRAMLRLKYGIILK